MSDKIAQELVLGEAPDVPREFTTVDEDLVVVITSSDVIMNRHCSTLTSVFANTGFIHT